MKFTEDNLQEIDLAISSLEGFTFEGVDELTERLVSEIHFIYDEDVKPMHTEVLHPTIKEQQHGDEFYQLDMWVTSPLESESVNVSVFFLYNLRGKIFVTGGQANFTQPKK